MRVVLLFATAIVSLAASSSVRAEQPATPSGPVSFTREVRPLFQQSCVGCHQPAKQQGGYLMTSFAGLFAKGESGEAGIIAGKPDASLLVKKIIPHEGKPAAMPKGGLPPFTAKEVALIKQWIAEGAKDDTPPMATTVVDADHPPVYLAPPVVTSVEFSPDGTLLAVSGYHEVLLYKADGSALVARLVGLAERIQSLAFSPDGKSLAVAGGSPGRFGEIQIWDVAKRKLKLSQSVTYDTLYGVSWSPDGKLVAFGCADNTLRAIEAASGKQVLFQGAHNDWVLDTVFSLDGSHLVSVSRDRSMKLTHVATNRFIDNITSITPGALKGGLQAVARHPKKEELLIGGADGTPKLYQMHRTKKRVIGDDFNLIRAYEPIPGRIFSVCFSADGNQFVVGSSLDGEGKARVYQTADGKKVSELAGLKGGIYSVAFSPDGKTIASAGFDGMVRLSNPATGALIKEFVSVPLAKK